MTQSPGAKDPDSLETVTSNDVLRITAKGHLAPGGILAARHDAARAHGMWTAAMLTDRTGRWNTRTDTLLLEHLNTQLLAGKRFDNPISLNVPSDEMEGRQYAFDGITLLDLQCRALFFQEVNKILEKVLPMVNLHDADSHSLGILLRQSNHYIFMRLKQPILARAISSTAAEGEDLPAQLVLDNFKALASRENGETEPSNSQCTFVQAFRQLQNSDARVFRHIFQGDRTFQINFESEPGIDAGGVFREGVSRMVEDLFGDTFSLLILCPNGQHDVHMNKDKYVPHPGHTGPLALKMMNFVGRLMGMSLRSKMLLPFDFPPLIWKRLLDVDVSFEDLAGLDAVTSSFLTTLRSCEEDCVADAESFNAKYGTTLTFKYTGADGVERELERGSGSRLVTWENRLDFCHAVERRRLEEFDEQVRHMAVGLGEVVPMEALRLFSWQQLEVLVAGVPTFNIPLWKKNTRPSGISKERLDWFWTVIESLSPRDQAGFVRFAWGRSRLPTTKDFSCKMKLSSAGRAALPIAHTCFFSIELPDYETYEKMRHGILTVIHYGVGGILIS